MDQINEEFLENLNLSPKQLSFFSFNCCKEQIFHLMTFQETSLLNDVELYLENNLSEEQLENIGITAWNQSSVEERLFCCFSIYYTVGTCRKYRITTEVFSANSASYYCRCALNHSQESIDFQHTILNDLIPPKNITFLNNPVVKILANEIYQDKKWDLIPVLCDLLIDCNFDDRFIEHLKEPYHRRGCWVLETLK